MVVRVMLALALAAGMASAQRGSGGGSKGGGGGDMGAQMPMRPQRQNKLDTIADKLKLNKDQKEQASKIFDAAQEEEAPFRGQLDQGRQAITGAMIQGRSADEVNKMMEQYSALLAQQAMVEAKAYGKLYALLDAKQQSKAAQVFATEMAGMFAGRNWRGGGGGFGGGRGEGR